MTRTELVKRLAEYATKPLSPDPTSSDHQAGMHQPVDAEAKADVNADAAKPVAGVARAVRSSGDLFVWFEDTAARRENGRRGIAGLPESLLPYDTQMRVVERRYAEGHLHLLSAVRLRCRERQGERIAAIYTAALSVGTVAWIGTGRQYELAWQEMFPYGADESKKPAGADDEACGA